MAKNVKSRDRSRDSDKKGRGTISIQVDEDLGQMIRMIAENDRVSQADVVRPALMAYIPAQMKRVQAELDAMVKKHAQSAG